MKKNISRFLMGAVAGLASLVLAACSGDLHQPLERPVVPGSTGAYTPSLEDANEVSIFFKTTEDRDYFFWAWNASLDGKAFTVAGTWPGDAFVLKGTDSDGKFIYKYTITTTTELPDSFIISYDGGGSKVYDGAAFVKNGLYVEGSEEAEVITAIAAPAPETPSQGGEGNEGEGSEGGNDTPAAPVEIALDATFLAKGDHDTSGVALTADAENEGAFYFTVDYRPVMSGWGGGNGNLHFKLNSDSTWYGFANVNAELSTSLAEGVSIAQGASDDHIVVQGLTDLTTYKISFKLTEDKTALVISVAATGTFDAPAGPTSYAAIEADETPGDAPTDEVHELDETSGILYTMTGLPSWYGNDGVHIWAMVTDDEGTVYWKRVKFVGSEGCIYFDSALTLKIVKTRRYKSDMSEYWNGSGSVDIVGTTAACTKAW